MNLKILLPTEILVNQRVTAVVAEAENGSFCLLPKHVDFVSALVPGILSFTDEDDCECFVGIGGAVLVKHGQDVRVSANFGIRGGDLGTVRETVSRRFESLSDREVLARSAIAKLEADLLRRFVELGVAHD